jgi:hypothetical protein
MDARNPAAMTRRICQKNRELLGIFFCSLQVYQPRWLSIINPVDGLKESCLTSLLGFNYEVGLEFLYSTGLAKKGSSRNPLAPIVVSMEWD